jgi:head-tail adaptor
MKRLLWESATVPYFSGRELSKNRLRLELQAIQDVTEGSRFITLVGSQGFKV